MTLQFFANDTTYSGSTVNIAADYQTSAPITNVSNHIKPMFILKALLKTCGWTVKSSADGVFSYNTGSDILTFGTASQGVNTVGDFGNSGAWFYIQSPGTSSQHFVIQRPTATTYYQNSNQWRIKYSTTGFWTSNLSGSTGLTGSLSVTPTAISASDEIYVAGGGTDASPTFTPYGPVSFAGLRAHMAANDQAPYGFWMVTYQYGLDPTSQGFYFINDYMLSGSFPGNDQQLPDSSPYTAATFSVLSQFTDPTQQFCMAGAFVRTTEESAEAAGLTSVEGVETVEDNAFPQPALVRWGAMTYNLAAGGTVLVPQGCGINPQTQKIDLLPIWYARRRDPGGNQVTLDQTGLKGSSGLIRFSLYNLAHGEVFDYAGTKDKVCFGFLVFDWNGVDTVVL